MPVNGLVVMTPTSIASTGTGNSSSINADGSVDFASCATLSLNGVFTSSYDNYMVTMRLVHNSTTSDVRIRFRASGTDNTTANSYTHQYIYANGSSVTALRASSSFSTYASANNSQRDGSTGYIFGPYLAQPTAYRTTNVLGLSNAGLIDFAGTHNQSVSYDGFTFSLSDPTHISGLITVFGFNQ